MLGFVPAGTMIRRAGARAGDRLLVSGQIGKGLLGLQACGRALADPDGAMAAWYRLPTPRLDLGPALRAHARAAADVSDGLIADAWHIAEASGLGLVLSLDSVPVPEPLADGPADALAAASGGDDYEIVCAVAPEEVEAFTAAALGAGATVTEIGVFEAGGHRRVTWRGKDIEAGPGGWRHI
jgi:thiamine-monophosphate kinase